MNELPSVNARIRRVINEKFNGNVSRFSSAIDVVPQKVNRFFNIDGRTNKYPDPNKTDILDRIEKVFNDINNVWLRTGDGEMIKMEGKTPFGKNYQVDKMGNVSEVNMKDSVTPLADESHMEVEYRDLSVAAGPLSRVDVKAPKKTLLVPKEYDRGEYLVVRVDGPSMDDGSIYSIPNGANILIKRYYLENGEKLPIRDNLFVVDAKDGQALKQITEHNTELGYITCHSYNKEFKDYNIPLEDVLAFYVFRKIVGFRPPVRDIQ
ncbi:S24 family peptidase [Epilithonimonas xixisoli]|uniref:Peptidase S24-like protein n=1 Tax=Epilithonimonas xixisoli TaxID=1476462 RepID=A0A4V3H2F9_9FLAO|nr:hypothetical protein [Epilithonimonas xixisoli]TDX83936.1 hypothetical protein B0I22_1524 [Epilithonimonas xixisoli]